MATTATIIGGIPATNYTLYHASRFACGDPAAHITIENGTGKGESTFIVRDIEMMRAKKQARADAVASPRDFEPAGGLSADRETGVAQAAAECIRRSGATRVRSDRTLPLSFVDAIKRAGFEVEYDPDLGVLSRRAKDEREVEALRIVQGITEEVMEIACRTVARASARGDGTLMHEGSSLTSERVNGIIDVWLLERGYTTPGNIVAAGAEGGDCHNRGTGPIRTGEPVIIDIFPQSRETMYCGDCTRTVVHGDIPDEIATMHSAVVESKNAGIAATRAGTTGDAVYRASIAVIEKHGFERALVPEDQPEGFCSMQHGLGHGVGLEVHEPPLLDEGGPELIVGDCLTIEPGLYKLGTGGIRVEDMVIVTKTGCENLNSLQDGLDWR